MIIANEPIKYEYYRVEKLEQLLSNLTDSLVEQRDRLDKHAAAIEALTQAVIQLEATIQKELMSQCRKSSPDVDKLIKLFVEYEINPRYYEERHHSRQETRHDSGYALVKARPNRPSSK